MAFTALWAARREVACEASPVDWTLSSLWRGEPSGTKMSRNVSGSPETRWLPGAHTQCLSSSQLVAGIHMTSG